MITITEEPHPDTVQGPRTRMNNFNDYVLGNERLVCEAEDCAMSRYGFSKHCRSHAKRSYEHGHPTAKPLNWAHYRKERREVAAFLSVKSNRHHAAIIAVSEELRQRLAICDDKAGEYWYRMQDARVQPLDIVVITAARILHARRHGSFAGDDERFIRTEIGKALARTIAVPKAQRPGGKPEEWRARLLRALGAAVLQIARDLCISLATAVERERAILDEAKRNAASAVFVSPSSGATL